MIRKLGEEDRGELIAFLSDEPAINLFIIGDVECYGFDADFQELWGSFENNRLNGVLLRYEKFYTPYYKDKDFDVSGFIEIIKNDKTKKGISGKSEILGRFKGLLTSEIIKETYFCELCSGEKLDVYGADIKIATEDKAEDIVALLRDIEEFRLTNATVTSENAVQSMMRKISDGSGRVYYMENDTEMTTVVQTTAENSLSAMIVGVATRKSARRKGQMSQCLSKLCIDVLQEGKTLCLFYDNPEAGSVYHRLGFESIGMWTMLIEGAE